MAVTLSSDLIAGVLNAAQPAATHRATLKLAGAHRQPAPGADIFPEYIAASRARHLSVSPGAAGGDIVAEVLAAADPGKSAAIEQKLASLSSGVVQAPTRTGALQGFESALLRNMFEMMLPPADSGAYGEGYSGSIWRSMAADQFASLYAARGGMGIAGMLSQDSGMEQVPALPAQTRQWPYFEASSIQSFASS